jgi:hypothetical protein
MPLNTPWALTRGGGGGVVRDGGCVVGGWVVPVGGADGVPGRLGLDPAAALPDVVPVPVPCPFVVHAASRSAPAITGTPATTNRRI